MTYSTSPRKVVQDITQEEVRFDRKPQVSQLRVFGFVAYVLIPYEKKTKLDPKCIKAMFNGYNDQIGCQILVLMR